MSNEQLEPPEYITKRAKKIFRGLMEALGADAKESDLSLYADFAQTSADIETLTAKVDAEGWTVETAGSVKANPAAQMLTQLRTQLAQLRRDLNLTPKARAEKGAKKAFQAFAGV